MCFERHILFLHFVLGILITRTWVCNTWRHRQDPKPMMNTRGTRRDNEDEITPETGEQRQTSSVLDKLIECQLREINNQNNLQIQHTERFNEIVSQ